MHLKIQMDGCFVIFRRLKLYSFMMPMEQDLELIGAVTPAQMLHGGKRPAAARRGRIYII